MSRKSIYKSRIERAKALAAQGGRNGESNEGRHHGNSASRRLARYLMSPSGALDDGIEEEDPNDRIEDDEQDDMPEGCSRSIRWNSGYFFAAFWQKILPFRCNLGGEKHN